MAVVPSAQDDFNEENEVQSIAELSAPMLAKELWVAFSTTVAPMKDVARLLQEHLRHMMKLEKQGVLFASGPLLEDDGTIRGDGITVIRAESRAEAEEILHSDPLLQAGMRSMEIRRWRIMEGRVTMTLDFSDRSYAFE